MSIAIIAPQMFDFQDSVCVEIMLRFFSFGGARFLVEPKNGEDAELQFAQAESVQRVAIQIKGSSSAVTLATIASCMAHTPSRTEKDTLLERMIADQNLWVVLVMKGRCDDASAIYTSTDWNGTPHSVEQLSTSHVRTLLKAFSNAKVRGSKASKLRAKRQEHNAAFAKRADTTSVRNALRRLIIIERVDDATLESCCADRLRADHNVPSDRIGDVLAQLRSTVKRAKTDGVDAFPILRETLASAAPRTVRPPGYILRDMESTWEAELSSTGVLLLSGMPRVGKSYSARWVGAEFESQGYEVLESSDISQVERFLDDPTKAQRLAILDDPLGSASTVAASVSVLDQIEKLITRLRLQRKLIVAQGTPQLLATARASALSQVLSAGKSWHDLGTHCASLLLGVWQAAVAAYDVPRPLASFVYDALSTSSLKLEPGCLEHLAANHNRLERKLDLANISRLAREPSKRFGHALAETGHEAILSTLAVTTVAQDRITVGELAFTMGSGGSALPGKQDTLGTGVFVGQPPAIESPKPTYEEVPKLSQRQIDLLDHLERHRVVDLDSATGVRFFHPFYRSAAESLVSGLTDAMSNRIVAAVQRGLFCLSPLTSQATAKNIDWIFDRLSNRLNAQSTLVDHAIDGLKSYFPVTRDYCFGFLIERLEDLPENRKSEAPHWTSQVTFIQLDDIVWDGGQATLPFGHIKSGDAMARLFERVEYGEVETELTLLGSPDGEYVGPDRAAKVLKYVRRNLHDLTVPAMGRILSYDVAALRAEAIELWLSAPRDDDELIIARIFGDEHPSCALGALRGSVAGWSEYSELRRAVVLAGMRSLARNTVCAAAMLNRLVLFDRVEITGQNPPWVIFEELITVVMQGLSHNAVFVDARLFNVVRVAAKVLSPTSVAVVCDAWISWLERNEAAKKLPSEFSLGVIEILLSSTFQEPWLRKNMIDRMLSFQSTGAMVAFVADLVDGWETLLDEEKNAVLTRLDTGRTDDLWLQAAAITRSIVPEPVQRVVLGNQVALTDGAEALVSKVPDDLLNAAIHIYSGRPQPLWWLGTHHGGRAVWEPVMELVARTPCHPLFELSWDHLFFDGDGVKMSNIIECVGVKHADRMLNIFIRLKVAWTGHYMPEAWASLLAITKDKAMRDSWLDKMALFVPAILDDLSDLTFWLSDEQDLRDMLSRLKSDMVVLQIIDIDTKSEDQAIRTEMELNCVQLLRMFLELSPPRLFNTCDRATNWLKTVNVTTNGLIEDFQRQREIILNERRRIEDECEEAEYSLCGWVEP